MDSVDDEILLGIILETCKTSEDAICFIHDTIFKDWASLIKKVCTSRAKQLKILQLILEVIATKLAYQICTCETCCKKLETVLSILCRKSKFVAVLTETVQKTNYQQDKLSKWFQHLYQFCDIVFKTFPSEANEVLANLVYACIGSLKKSKPINSGLITKFVGLKRKLNKAQQTPSFKPIEILPEPTELVKHVEPQWDDMEPPDNFRKISIIPTLEELTREEMPFLRPNKTIGSYQNLEHYLDIQFRLLREDFVRPLRRTIQEFMKTRNGNEPNAVTTASPLEKTSVRVYKDVVFHRRENVTFDNTTHFIFELPKVPWRRVNWNKSKRLLPGSLVMLTSNLCKTAIFAVTVAPPFDPKKAREEGNLNQTRKEIAKGILRLAIESGSSNVNPSTNYLMFECEAFFEAYRHNLAILQNMQIWSETGSGGKSLNKYIIEGCGKVDYPQYLISKEIKNYKFPIESADECCADPTDLKNWPNEVIQQQMGLDSDQYAALKTALTSELAVIQGPPGTGKTYVGLQIVKTLLHNKRYNKISNSPFLILCYTNHALDQFLELLLGQFDDLKLVRVGGQTKSALVQDHTLYEHRKKLKALARAPDDSIMCYDKQLYQYSRYEYSQVRKEGKANRSMRFLEAEHQRIGNEIEQMSNPEGVLDFNQISVAQRLSNMVGIQFWKLMKDTNWLGFRQDDFAIRDFDVRQVLTRLFDLKPECLAEFGNDAADTTNSLSEEDAEETGETEQNVDNSEYDLKELLEHRLLEENFLFERPQNTESNIYLQNCSLQELRVETKMTLNHFKSIHENFIKSEQDPTQSKLLQQQAIDFKKQVNEYENKAKFLEAVFKLHEDNNLNLPDVDGKFHMPSNYVGDRRYEFGDVLSYPFDVRWAIYFKVLEIALDISIQLRDQVAKQLADARKTFSNQRQMLDGSILQNCDIIGMTTTGAAKMHALLEKAKPQIVIVEEAAEILEAHIVTALTEDCKHLILIGDHLQLRPSANVYELWSKYKLNVSLFERMILNGVPLCTLKTQHRMRPNIADLIVGPIYNELHNHPKVHNYPSVRGVGCNLFFVVHKQWEDTDMEIMSKTNFHEAAFLVGLCDYLLKQNYQPQQITILTTYTGQMFLLKKIIPDNSLCKGVRVTSVDNYQGEENDIILLSLVRSNATNNVGFVGLNNRICVALSRARHGLFIIGNMSCMKQASKTWKQINYKLSVSNNIGPALPLKCQRHSNITWVRAGDDFQHLPSGGCTKLCAAKLDCGHLCPYLCHVQNPNHKNLKCIQRCRKYCKFNHQCFSACSAKCPPCQSLIARKLSCGHDVRMRCCVDPKTVKCPIMVIRQLPCKFNHNVEMECFRDARNFWCPVLVQKVLKCGHVETVECGLPLDQATCSIYIDKELRCGHTAKVQCSRKEENIKCNIKVKKELACGHEKVVKCSTSVDSVLCYVNVDVVMSVCSHLQNIPCYSQSTHRCEANCDKLLPCGHLCRLTCHEDKDPNHLDYKCKEICKQSCEYGHPCKFNHECFQKCYPCAAQVTVSLICGHTLEVGCGHRNKNHWCEEKIKRKLPCGHEQKVLCQAEPEKQKCLYPIVKCGKKCKMGHFCFSNHACGAPCPPCNTNTEKTLECEHSVIMPCSENISSYSCKEKIRMKCKKCSLEVSLKCGKRKIGICKNCEDPRQGHNPKSKRTRSTSKCFDTEAPKKGKKASPAKSKLSTASPSKKKAKRKK